MAIVYCDLVNGIDWYSDTNVPVWASGTTYAKDALVKAAAGTSLTSATAQVWKSLQDANTGNALAEGAWWTLVADGSAAKPWKSVDDSTRGMTGGDFVRGAKSADHSAITGSWIFYASGANKFKAVASGDHTSEVAVGDYIGNNSISFWKVTAISYAGGNTTATCGFVGFADVALDTTYKPTCIDVTTLTMTPQSNGLINSALSITFGWDLSTQLQTGYTWVKMATPGQIWNNNSKNYIQVSRLGVIKATDAFLMSGAGNVFSDCHAVDVNRGFRVYGSKYYNTLNNCICPLAGNECIVPAISSDHYAIINDFVGVGYSSPYNDGLGICILNNCYIYTKTAPICSYTALRLLVNNCVIDAPSTLTVSQKSDVWIRNTSLINVVFSSIGAILARTVFHNYDNVQNDNRYYCYSGNVLSDSTTRHTASGIAHRYEPNASATSLLPLEMLNKDYRDFLEVAVAANSQVTATIWAKKSDADSAFEAQFICKGGQLAGIASDVTAVATDSTDWQQLTIQVTPSEAGVLRFGFQVWGSATATCHIDDFGVTQ